MSDRTVYCVMVEELVVTIYSNREAAEEHLAHLRRKKSDLLHLLGVRWESIRIVPRTLCSGVEYL